MKSPGGKTRCKSPPSLPSRGARVEIVMTPGAWMTSWSLPSRGARVEIMWRCPPLRARASRSPRGERGLKYQKGHQRQHHPGSLPSRGARVEIITFYLPVILPHKSLPSRGARVEISSKGTSKFPPECRSPRGERGLKLSFYWAVTYGCWSLPSRGARVEISSFRFLLIPEFVAPLAGSEG